MREGGKHSIYTNDEKIIPIKRHRIIDRITANEFVQASRGQTKVLSNIIS